MSSSSRVLSRPGLAGVVAAVLVSAGCGGGSDDSPGTALSGESLPTASESPTSEAPTEDPVTPSPSPAPEAPEETDAADVPGGVVMVGDKSVFLDGFFGVRLPEGWSVTSAEVPLRSVTPEGGETELDASALSQSLVLNPDASPRGATLALVHYEHSDSVPDLVRFSTAVVDLLSGDGSQIGESSEVTIGKQPGRLHQVTSSSGSNGVLITLRAADEYFFLLSLAAESEYAGDTAELLGSISMVPEALHS